MCRPCVDARVAFSMPPTVDVRLSMEGPSKFFDSLNLCSRLDLF
jgi:hypothetical protein